MLNQHSILLLAPGRRHSLCVSHARFALFNIQRDIRVSDPSEKAIPLTKQYGVNRKTIAEWRRREAMSDEPIDPKNPLASFSPRAVKMSVYDRTQMSHTQPQLPSGRR